MILASVVDVAIWTVIEYRDQSAFCNFYDALTIGIECRTFVGSQILETLLNWPLFLYYSLVFGLYSIDAFIFALLVWSPIILSLWACFRRNEP